jgi:hypothetical protein
MKGVGEGTILFEEVNDEPGPLIILFLGLIKLRLLKSGIY